MGTNYHPGDKVKLVSPTEWQHLKNKRGIVSRVLANRTGTYGIMIKIPVAGDIVELLRMPSEIAVEG
jgi:hypothetical protein